MRPLLAWLSGDLTDTSPSAAEAVRVGEDSGNPASLMLALEAQALTHLKAGHPADAVAACEGALRVARDKRSGLFAEASVLAHLALAHLDAADHAAARLVADEAVEVARRQGARVHECLALLTRAHVARSSSEITATVGADLETALILVGNIGALRTNPSSATSSAGSTMTTESCVRRLGSTRPSAPRSAPVASRRTGPEAGDLPPRLALAAAATTRSAPKNQRRPFVIGLTARRRRIAGTCRRDRTAPT